MSIHHLRALLLEGGRTGGVLSHCAVVAREYGIPAVVGTRSIATVAIKDGDTIEVDGDAGIVRIV